MGVARMDKEFHYYLTYLTAARAGFSYNDALTIAQACQAVDDNHTSYEINPGGPDTYQNFISQTMNPLKPEADKMRIYPVFHFIPGDSNSPSAKRSDGAIHPLNTTPDSELANRSFGEAAKTNNLMELGIACHAYADTWAHQNFIGFWHEFNGFKGLLNDIIPNIGHADAKHAPDWPAHIWTDTRLTGEQKTVNNKIRFLNAAKRLYEKLCGFLKKDPNDLEYKSMLSDFSDAIGPAKEKSNNKGKKARINQYCLLATRSEYKGKEIPNFDFDDWWEDTIRKEIKIKNMGEADEYYNVWRHPKNYSISKWFHFQEAVKSYQRRTLKIYNETVYSQLNPDLLARILKFS